MTGIPVIVSRTANAFPAFCLDILLPTSPLMIPQKEYAEPDRKNAKRSIIKSEYRIRINTEIKDMRIRDAIAWYLLILSAILPKRIEMNTPPNADAVPRIPIKEIGML